MSLKTCGQNFFRSVLISGVYTSTTEVWSDVKVLSYQFRKAHCGDETVVGSPYLRNGIPYTDKTSLYSMGIQGIVLVLRKWDHFWQSN